MREYREKIQEALAQLDYYTNRDDLARIEFFLVQIEDNLQSFREEIRNVLAPKPKRGRPPKNKPAEENETGKTQD